MHIRVHRAGVLICEQRVRSCTWWLYLMAKLAFPRGRGFASLCRVRDRRHSSIAAESWRGHRDRADDRAGRLGIERIPPSRSDLSDVMDHVLGSARPERDHLRSHGDLRVAGLEVVEIDADWSSQPLTEPDESADDFDREKF